MKNRAIFKKIAAANLSLAQVKNPATVKTLLTKDEVREYSRYEKAITGLLIGQLEHKKRTNELAQVLYILRLNVFPNAQARLSKNSIELYLHGKMPVEEM